MLSAGYSPLQRVLVNKAAGPEMVRVLAECGAALDGVNALHALMLGLCTEGPLQVGCWLGQGARGPAAGPHP
jgi:hypothetical protein